MTEVGARVFALRDADDDTVYLYGFGVYAGKHIPPGQEVTDEDLTDLRAAILYWDAPEAAASLDASMVEGWELRVAAGKMDRATADENIASSRAAAAAQRARPIEERVADMARRTRANPRIDLDGGGVVWGYQCWWGPIEKWDDLAAGREVVAVPVPQ